MKAPFGKYTCLLVLWLGMAVQVIAQSKQFLFLQSSNQKPFTVTIDDRDFNSSQHGYAAVSQLGWGRYLMEVRFVERGKSTPIRFVVEVKDTDLGYELVEAGLRNWVLKDLVSGKTIEADKAATANTEMDQPFGQLLPALVQEKVPAVVKTMDSSALAPSPILAPALPGKISRTYTLATAKGMDLVFVDKTGQQADTIVLHIPENEVVAAPAKPNGGVEAAMLADRLYKHSFAVSSYQSAAIISRRWPDISLK